MIYVTGPGHGGPALIANTYLEGSYSEIYPEVSQDTIGLQRLFRQFSTPGGVPSHVSVPTPGSIHEGGELGYALVHAFGAAFDNPDLIVACVVGDGEAETGPLEGSWKSIRFLEPGPRRRRAADPAPQRLQDQRSDRARPGADRRRARAARGHGYEVHVVAGDEPDVLHREMAEALDRCVESIQAIQHDARAGRGGRRSHGGRRS